MLPGKASAANTPRPAPPKLNACFIAVWNWLAPDERARTPRGLFAPAEPDERHLLPHRFDGEQLLGHPAYHARLGFCDLWTERHRGFQRARAVPSELRPSSFVVRNSLQRLIGCGMRRKA